MKTKLLLAAGALALAACGDGTSAKPDASAKPTATAASTSTAAATATASAAPKEEKGW